MTLAVCYGNDFAAHMSSPGPTTHPVHVHVCCPVSLPLYGHGNVNLDLMKKSSVEPQLQLTLGKASRVRGDLWKTQFCDQTTSIFQTPNVFHRFKYHHPRYKTSDFSFWNVFPCSICVVQFPADHFSDISRSWPS